MFDFGLGATELLFIAIVALIVVGPKDLPRLLRTMGQYMRKIQSMAREFQNHLNEAAREAGVDDVKKEVKGMTNFTVTADLDKQGAEIKRAIESSATRQAGPTGSPPSKPADAPTAEGNAAGTPEPARIEQEKAATAAKPEPKPKAEAKPAAGAKPKASPKPKPATKAATGKQSERTRESVKS